MKKVLSSVFLVLFLLIAGCGSSFSNSATDDWNALADSVDKWAGDINKSNQTELSMEDLKKLGLETTQLIDDVTKTDAKLEGYSRNDDDKKLYSLLKDFYKDAKTILAIINQYIAYDIVLDEVGNKFEKDYDSVIAKMENAKSDKGIAASFADLKKIDQSIINNLEKNKAPQPIAKEGQAIVDRLKVNLKLYDDIINTANKNKSIDHALYKWQSNLDALVKDFDALVAKMEKDTTIDDKADALVQKEDQVLKEMNK